MNRVSIRHVARAIHQRRWAGEEAPEVRVTCNEQDVLETVMEGISFYCITRGSKNQAFYCVTKALQQTTVSKSRRISGFISEKRRPSSPLSDV